MKNFSVDKCGYHLLVPPCLYGMTNAEKILFGPRYADVFLGERFFVYQGVYNLGGYFLAKELRSLIDKTINLIHTHPKKINAVHKKTYEINSAYLSFAKETLRKDLGKLTNKELGKIFLELLGWQEKAHQHALITTWFVDSDGEDLSRALIEKAKDLVKRSGSDINFADAFSILTTLPEESLGMKEEKESLKVLRRIKADARSKKSILTMKDFSHIPDTVKSDVRRAIEKHFEKWRWMPFGYLGPAYEIDHYLKNWSHLLKQKFDIEKELSRLQGWQNKVKKEQKTIVQKLRINKKDQMFFEIAADIVFLKGYRKECVFFGSYVLDRVLTEISRRLFVSLNQLHTMTHREIWEALSGKRDPDMIEINARAKFSVMHYKKGKFRILTGDQARSFFEKQNIKEVMVDTKSKELRGTCACSGQARGKVVIVNTPEEIPKMSRGNIMVAHTTFPSLVPAMKLASAIVTEDGGITCHAAIVSRELGTPCVTGIKMALQVLQDGMKVEVNADEGIVRIVQK